MTSAISPPRRLLADCSPSTHRTASTTFDFPLPLGPTTAVTPGGNSNAVLSAKLLNPTNSSRFSMVQTRRLNHGGTEGTEKTRRDHSSVFLRALRASGVNPAPLILLRPARPLVRRRRHADAPGHRRQPVALADGRELHPGPGQVVHRRRTRQGVRLEGAVQPAAAL